jgi:hypothetical protein
LRPVTLPLRPVTLSLRPVTLPLRPVTLSLRPVTLPFWSGRIENHRFLGGIFHLIVEVNEKTLLHI